MISVISVTNKINDEILPNICDNFKKQKYPNKELIVIINNNNIDYEKYKKHLEEEIDNFQLYKLNENITLGSCLNYSYYKMKGEYWAKFDDDDFYGENYLVNNVFFINKTGADLLGKKTIYMYVKNGPFYRINKKRMRFVDFIWGPTFFCKKKLFELILFDDINKGEDTKFISKCIRMNKKIFATDERDFVYIRDPILNQTCKNSLKKILGKNYEIVHKKFI